MIKIIKEGYTEPKTVAIYTITCDTCGCVFEASAADFDWVNRGTTPAHGIITCPHCKKKITIDKYTPVRIEKVSDDKGE